MSKPVKLGTRYTMMKNRVIKSLESFQIYNKDTDEILINELVYNVKVMDDCKQAIQKEGLKINTVRDPEKDPYYQQNPSVTTYQKSVTIVASLLTKLNITPQEREKLDIDKIPIAATEDTDELGAVLKGKTNGEEAVKELLDDGSQ